MFISGSARNGSNAVTVNGKACVIQYVAIKMVSAATCHADGSIPLGAGKNSITAKTISPPQNPMRSLVMGAVQSARVGGHIRAQLDGSCAGN